MSGLSALLSGGKTTETTGATDTAARENHVDTATTNVARDESAKREGLTGFADAGTNFRDVAGKTTETVGAESTDENVEPKLIATSAPIQNFKIGRFQFTKAVLNLFEDKDVDDFRALVKSLPPADRNQIRIIDRDAAERMVRPIEPSATKQFDSSVGRHGDTIGGGQTVGTKPLDAGIGGQGEAFVKRAHQDNNTPVAGTEANHVVTDVNGGDVQSQEAIDQQKRVDEQTDGKTV